jgi:hypothetical protein
MQAKGAQRFEPGPREFNASAEVPDSPALRPASAMAGADFRSRLSSLKLGQNSRTPEIKGIGARPGKPRLPGRLGDFDLRRYRNALPYRSGQRSSV